MQALDKQLEMFKSWIHIVISLMGKNVHIQIGTEMLASYFQLMVWAIITSWFWAQAHMIFRQN